MRFRLPGVQILAEPATTSLDDFTEAAGKRLRRRGFRCGPTYATPVAGYPDGRGRVVLPRKRGRVPQGEPQIQLYTMAGPFSLVLTISESHDELARRLGPVWLYPPAPPAVSPVAEIPAADLSCVTEVLTITQDGARLTAAVAAGLVQMPPDQFVAAGLALLQRENPTMAMGGWQPDVSSAATRAPATPSCTAARSRRTSAAATGGRASCPAGAFRSLSPGRNQLLTSIRRAACGIVTPVWSG